MTGIVMTERCQGPCGKQVSPQSLTPWGAHVRICEDCRVGHYQAIDLLCEGKPPDSCQRCHMPIEVLKAQHPKGEPSFVMHQLDGIYVAICELCDAHIQQLTKHMYRNTPHGAYHKLQ